MTRTPRSPFLLSLFALLGAPACVLNPTWGDEPTRRDPIDFSGMVSRANAPGRIQAWNHTTGAFETVATFTATSTRYASDPDLYGWSRVGVRLADRYWVGATGSCRDGGMANLRVQEQNTNGTFSDLATFDEAGEDCLYDRIADGDHPVAAGNACKRENATIVLFAPPQCVTAPSSDATPPAVTVRLANATTAYERTTGETDRTVSGVSRLSTLTATALVRDRDGAVTRAQLTGSYTLRCRRAVDGDIWSLTYPISSIMSRSVTVGTLADIAIEVNRPIDVPALVTATCPSGYAFYRIDGSVVATGTNVVGTVVSSPRLTFSI